MATGATGTPTSLGIPTLDTDVDNPDGDGINSMMASLDTIILGRVPKSPALAADGTVQPTADVVPLTVKGKTSQTADLQQWQTSLAAVLARITAAGAAEALSYSAFPLAAANTAFLAKVVGDSVNRLLVQADGKMEWGSGSTTRDTNFYRSAANALRTDGSFEAAALRGTVGANLTISGGALTVTNTVHRITSGTAPATINGGVDGMVVILINKTGGVLTYGTGGNVTVGVSTPDNGAEMFVYSTTDSKWCALG